MTDGMGARDPLVDSAVDSTRGQALRPFRLPERRMSGRSNGGTMTAAAMVAQQTSTDSSHDQRASNKTRSRL